MNKEKNSTQKDALARSLLALRNIVNVSSKGFFVALTVSASTVRTTRLPSKGEHLWTILIRTTISKCLAWLGKLALCQKDFLIVTVQVKMRKATSKMGPCR